MKLTIYYKCLLSSLMLVGFLGISGIPAWAEDSLEPHEILEPFVPVSGTVTDEEGQPLIGASVRAKGTTIGALTD